MYAPGQVGVEDSGRLREEGILVLGAGRYPVAQADDGGQGVEKSVISMS